MLTSLAISLLPPTTAVAALATAPVAGHTERGLAADLQPGDSSSAGSSLRSTSSVGPEITNFYAISSQPIPFWPTQSGEEVCTFVKVSEPKKKYDM